MRCGLLGRRLGHSHSPRIHALFADYAFELFEREPEGLNAFFKEQAFDGLMVTIPYKRDVMRYCARIDPAAARIGALNALARESDGSLTGYNTDYFGFLSLADHAKIDLGVNKALVLGTGGTSRTVSLALEDRGAKEVLQVSREGTLNYANIGRHADAELIVNTTPVGMSPDITSAPVELSMFPSLKGVIDVVYNPLRTKLVLDARRLSLPAAGGLYMLVAQAKAAAELFCRTPIPEELVLKAFQTMSRALENIVLVGMPGSGKTAIGRRLAEKMGREFYDTDARVEALAGKSIPEIFNENGEPAFRALERRAVKELAGHTKIVLATGGGAPLDIGNRDALRSSGYIVCLQRELSALAREGRPLSADPAALEKMAEVRLPIYRDYADLCIKNEGAIDAIVDAILEEYNAHPCN
ncbi:MAG: shikimate kinase [Bacillota bacterium]